ncbi:hypothetical protein [Streptomyces sp. NBC_00199]|uniref:hypothetical protein n=1 Tax=Streptomyces sp. NBC_00199 TaxID=2975678 RepID=UPI00225293CA|nr:hypothetical protein [Streptomyces sp. NBC_00199]MCX5269375.1 hypothetical protein [Streptomyces sp. NBC_00199]
MGGKPRGEAPVLVWAMQSFDLFAVGGSGRVWKSTTASWFDDFEVVASNLRELFEQLGRRIADHP